MAKHKKPAPKPVDLKRLIRSFCGDVKCRWEELGEGVPAEEVADDLVVSCEVFLSRLNGGQS